MNRRMLVIGGATGLAGLCLPNARALAQEPLKLRWSDLVPPAPPRPPNRTRPLVAEGDVDIMEFALKDGPLPNIHADPSEPEGRWMSRPRRTRRPPAAVVEGLNGKRVTIGGYVVPLDLEARSVKELLLVPFVGACIHVPPPPSNQVIHVVAERAFSIRDLFDPVWVTGRLSIVHATLELADVGYRIEAERIEPRPG